MVTWVDKLKREYAEGKRVLEAHRKTLDINIKVDAEDLEQISGMISDLQFGINYMHTGRCPGSIRGIDRRAAYQRSFILDTELFPSLFEGQPRQERILTDVEHEQMMVILCRLSTRERQCFILHAAYGLSYADIAKELKLSKGVTQTYINRARSKVQQGL